MSPMAPAGSAKTKNGSAEAVCVSATKIGPALSEIMSQAAPTLCMNVPISERTSAMNRFRKVGARNGRQRLGFSVAVVMFFGRYDSQEYHPKSLVAHTSFKLD